MNKRLILNRIRTPDGTILTSYNRHDYVSYTDKNGENYMVDGGLDYLRRNVNKEPFMELSVYVDDNSSHEVIRENLHWGTRGKDGHQPLTYKAIKELTDDHIQAILDTQNHISTWLRGVFENELEYRKNL